MNSLYKIRTIKCIGCTITITKRLKPNTKYCTLTCYRISKRPQRRNGSIVQCMSCLKNLYRPFGRLIKQGSHFCDIACHNNWQARYKTKHKCKICNKDFKWSPSRIKQSKITYCSINCRDKDPMRYDMLIKLNIEQQRKAPNKIEAIGYNILDRLAIAYKKQHLINGKFCVDAFIESHKIIIQFDGDYWHGHPEKFPNLDKRQLRRIKLDISQDAYMTKCGYKVIRFWESDLLKRKEHITNSLKKALNT